MLFSSTLFLFVFLPIVLTLHWALRGPRARNALLLASSLIFYAWGEVGYVLVLLASIAMNHAFGLWIDRRRADGGAGHALACAVAANLGLLISFKYTNFIVGNVNVVLAVLGSKLIEVGEVHLPIGISFFTFQALTYVVDVYRGVAPVQRSPTRVALYISLFPQLVAGPIVRYGQIAGALARRHVDAEAFAQGARRFTIGLAKKVLVANTLAIPADRIFAVPPDQIGASVAWLGILCFTLQIYFDFSGYSDMAIGIGRCLGFDFPENFDWPYTARSVREFWRRWHISLSTFFRDYLYIPIGGSRGGAAHTHVNLMLVFVLCGLWHGASWSFVIWGLIHGCFLVLERTRFSELVDRAPRFVQSAYVMSVVVFGWVFFRADDFAGALAYLAAMMGMSEAHTAHHPFALYWNAQLGFALVIGLLALVPTWKAMQSRRLRFEIRAPIVFGTGRLIVAGALFWLSAMSLAAGTHNPFIYFRF